jgi:hypothetical protein
VKYVELCEAAAAAGVAASTIKVTTVLLRASTDEAAWGVWPDSEFLSALVFWRVKIERVHGGDAGLCVLVFFFFFSL